MNTDEIKTLIENGLTTSFVDVVGDGTHFEAIIVSDEFEDKMLIDRHKLVYGALGDAMKEAMTKVKEMFEAKGVKNGYEVYHSGFGSDGPYYQ